MNFFSSYKYKNIRIEINDSNIITLNELYNLREF